MKTRKQFEQKAIREAERRLRVPPGWWGTYQHVRGPKGVEVRRIGGIGSGWRLKQHGKAVSLHDSRSFAISKGSRLARGR